MYDIAYEILDRAFAQKGKQFQKVVRELLKNLESKLLIKLAQGRPLGRDEKKSERDHDIREKYNLMLSEGYSHRHIRKTLSEEYGIDDIKQIYYSQK